MVAKITTLLTRTVEICISCVVKGYHQCPFKVHRGEVFSVSKKRGNVVMRLKYSMEEASLAIFCIVWVFKWIGIIHGTCTGCSLMQTELVFLGFIRLNENRNLAICSSKFDVESYNLLAQVPTCSTLTVNLIPMLRWRFAMLSSQEHPV